MKVNKFMLVGILLLTILFMGAVSAAEEYDATTTDVAVDTGDYVLNSPVTDEIDTGGDVNSSDSSSAISTDVKSVENSKEKLGVSNDEDVLGIDYDYILTPQEYKDQGLGHQLASGSYKFEGTFRADDGFWSFISFDDGCIVDGSEAEFVGMGIILNGNCQITGLTLTSTEYLEDDGFGVSPGAIVFVTGDDNILDGITVNYAPAADGDAYGIYAIDANNFQLLNSNITFTGSSLEEYYEYAMRMETCDNVLVQANKITANLPILNVDYNKGDPGLATDLVLNTGIREVTNLNIINNTFIANVVDRNGDYPTLDCVMMEYCGYVNVTNNKFRETDFITNEGDANYLNVLDMYYSSNVLVNGNDISVETTGGSENAGTSYPIQLTGPYENVLIDGNDLYANCGGPALGIFSQNYYGDTEITVQNNNIDVTGLPTDHSWGLVSGIELQDNVARVYNNTITTKSITGSYEDDMNIYGISYAQALNENHNYDIRGNVIETEGKYAIYLLKAQDTTITDNYLVSSVAEGDDAVYIQDASGDTVIENNHGAKESNVVTQDNFYEFFDDEGKLLDTVEFDELIFKGEFENLVDYISISGPLTIIGEGATLKNIGFIIKETEEITLDNLKLVADTPLGVLIDVSDSLDISLTNLNIIYDGGDEMAVAINVAGDNINILNNTIFFESHVPDDTEFAVGLKLTSCTDILVDGNDITTKLPCVYCNNYDEDYYMMGSDKVDPVRLKDCRNLVFTNNFINSTTNNYSAEFPTIQSIQIIGCKNSILDNNYISMIDEMTPAGMDNYLYGINFGYNRNVTFSNNNFNMSTKGGKDAAGTAYAFQGVESEVNIVGNSITSISNGPNLGVYVASMFGGDSDLIIKDNFINVTGSASSVGTWALVSGIEIQNGDAKIYNNTVYTYNVNDYDDYAYIYGISYAQWMYGERSFDIQDNTVYTEGKYAISVINATSLNAERNTLYAHELTGDDSVNPGSCADVNIKDNLPKKITNIVTQDNFYDFFDEFGNLLDSVEFDELIFQGDFADLVSCITIDRALTITGDDAVLNDIAFVIAGSDVTLDNMTLVANSNLGNLIDIAVENVVISNMDITYVVDEAASAINVYPGANNVQILNNAIYFESTVDEYAMDEITTAICVNSGVSVFDDEDPIEGLVIDGNDITAVIPAFLADIYENEYYVMGLSAVNGVRINGAEDFKFTNNNLNVTTNWLYRTTPTFQALYVASSSGLIDGNNISMIDTFTPAGKDVYLYAVELIKDEELTISNNNFNLSTTGGKDEAGSAYAIIAIDSDFSVVDNNITTVSNGPNIAIYFPSNMGAPCDAVILGNFINVTGLATAAHNTGLVSGIEIQTGDVEITGNAIYTYSIGEYAEGNYIYGISYAQKGSTPDVVITDNTVYTEGHYAISFLEVDDAVITDNYLVSTDLKGDGAVEIKEGSGNTVENNTPESSPANISIEANSVWIGSNATVSVSVPNATGTVTIEINGKSYTIVLDNGAATIEIPAEDLIAGENNVAVTYNGPEYAPTTVDDVIVVLDGVVTQDTYLLYFNQADNGRLFDYVPDGATLDFQGSIINPDQKIIVQMNVNKPVNIISSTGDAYVDLNTTAGSLLGESPGNSFAITYGGSGTNVTGINFHNTQLWFSNTHNVILDNISNVVEDQKVGSGVGATSIRDNSTNVTLKNSYFYTRNNGGSTTFTFSWASNCTIDNCTLRAEGNVGNLLYLNIFNVVGAPTGVPLNNYNVISNNKIYGKEGSGISVGLMVEGKGNLIVNNTLYKSSISTSFGGVNPSDNIYVGNVMTDGSGLTAQTNSIVYGNNVTGALSTGSNSVAYDNIVGGKMTVSAGVTAYNNTVGNGLATGGANAIIENNTITGAVTINKVGTNFVGNDVAGTVTVSANNNVIKGNNIITTGNYAVDLGSKTGNNVTDNYLVSALYKGDKAVKFTNANNVVENNTPVVPIDIVAETVWIGNDAVVTVTVANTTGTVTISVNGKEETVDLVDGVATVTVSAEDLVAGENNVAVTYNGPEYAPATVDDTILVLDGVITNSTYKYYFDASGNLVSIVPNGVTLDFQGLFLGKFPVYINKAVNVVSTTGDALFDCGASYAGNNINSFNIVAGGDNTNITGLEFINYCLYIKGASNVTVDDISIVANKRGVGSGTGFLSIHTGAYNTLVKNSYFENGGTGSSLLVLGKGGAYAVFDHNVFNITGSSGNILSANQFVGTGNSPEHVSYTNNVLYNNQPGSAFCYAMTVSGSGNLVENNTIYHNGSGILNQYGASSSGNVYRNNTLYGNTNFNPSANSIVENNKIYATTNIAANTTVSGNTFTTVAISGTNTKFVNNTVAGTVTVKGNANSIVGNNIAATGEYAIDLGTTTGNNVTDNYLVSASYGGDAAVKYSNANNVVENNSPKGYLAADRFEDGLVMPVGSHVLLNATLTDDAGKAISGATVVFLLNDTEYSAVTDAQGKAQFDLSGIAGGEYLVNYRFDGNDGYSKSNLTVNDKLTVSLITAYWYYIESIAMLDLNGSVISTPWNSFPASYVEDEYGDYLPKGYAITVKFNDTIINTNIKDNIGSFDIDMSGIRPGTYTVTFSADKYTSAVATVTVEKIPTSITVKPSSLKLEVNDEVASGATLTPADAGNLTYTVSNASVVKVENDKIIALAEGTATITVSFAGDNEYVAAENKTISVTVKLKDASVSVNNNTVDLFVEETFDIIATTTPEGLNVTYVPDDSGVVSVDANGVVTALKEGTASIIVKVGGDGVYTEKSVTVTVTVSKVPTEISVDPSSLDLFVDDSAVIAANLTPADAGNVTFKSSDDSVVTVDAQGNVIAVGEGSATITVSFAGDDTYAAAQNVTVTVTVSKVPTEISVANATVDMEVNDEVSTGASLTPADAGNVTYTISNSSVVKVEDGKIIALAEGSAVITVSFAGDDKYAAAENKTISVTVKLKDASVSVENATLNLLVDENGTIVAVTVPEGLAVTYVPDDSGVVSVDEDGVVTALKEGTASIIVKVGGDGVYAENTTTVTVTVSKVPTEISVANATVDMEVNDEVSTGASLTPADAGVVTYTVSNSSVVKVEDGKIIALAEGSATITVSFAGDDKYAAAENMTIEVTVKLRDASVSVENATLELLVGDNGTIVAVTVPEGLAVTYVPDDSGVVSVDEDGVVTALKEGTASIIVKVGGDGVYAENTTTVTVTVSKVPTEISIENATVDMEVNDEVSTGATLTPADAGNVTYTISNSSVVKVEDGKIIALAEGSAVITVSFAGDDKYAEAENKTIEVTVKLRDASVSVENATLELLVGDNGTIVAVTVPEGLAVTYVPDDSGIIAVGEDGVVTALKEGTASVIVKVGGDGVYAENTTTVTVTVSKVPTEISVDPAAFDLVVGNESSIAATLTPADAGIVTFTSSDDSVVTVDDKGNVIAVGEGSAVITVSFAGDDKYAEAENKTIEVTVKLRDASVSVENATLELLVGDNGTIVAVTVPEGLAVTYVPDDSGIIAVDEDGVVTALKEGTASIIVKVGGDGVYAENTTTVTVTVSKVPTEISVDPAALDLVVGNESSIAATLTPADAGIVTFTSSDDSVVTVDDKGNVIAVGEGSATITVSFAGNDKYAAAENVTVSVFVAPKPKENATISIDAPSEATEGDNVTVTVTLPEDATGTVTIGNEVIPVVNGTASAVLTDIPAGNTTIPITYSGDDKYNPIETEVNISVEEDTSDIISAPDVTKYFHGSERFVVTVTDSEGTPLAGKSVTIVVNGVSYSRTTNANGTTTVALGLDAGVYNVTTTMDNQTVDSVVTILTTVNGTDIVKVYRNATQYYATFLDSEGNYLAEGTEVQFNINGVLYTRKVAENGLAKLNINLEPGEYIITALNHETGEMSSNNITVIPRIVENSDLTKYYRNASQYTVKIIGDDGNPVGAGEEVTFNINGVLYTRTTNASGIAKLNINLNPGDYVVTAEYKGSKVSNNIKVLPILTADDITMKYRDGTKFVATLVDGQGKPYAEQTVQFNINGVFYNRVTDSTGQAKLNINLMAGQYIITSSYGGSSISNTITITA